MKYSKRRVSRMMSDDLTKKIEEHEDEQVIYGAVQSKEMDLYSLLDTGVEVTESPKSESSIMASVLMFFMFILIVGTCILFYSLLWG